MGVSGKHRPAQDDALLGWVMPDHRFQSTPSTSVLVARSMT